METFRLKEPVYYIESQNDETVLLGINIRLVKKNERTYISWFDTVHERMMEISKIGRKEDGYVFKCVDSPQATYFILPITLDLYEEKIRKKLVNGKHFDNLEDLIAELLETLDDYD